MIEIVVTVIVIALVAVYWHRRLKASRPMSTGKMVQVPKVSGVVPILGHGISYGINSAKFLADCKAKYGVPFEINLAGKKIIMMDGKMRKEMFASLDSFLNFSESVAESILPEFTIGREIMANQWHTPIIRKYFSTSLVGRFHHRFPSAINTAIDKQLSTCKSVGDKCTVPSVEPLAWAIIASCSARSFCGDRLGASQRLQDVFVSFHKNCFKLINIAPVVPYIALHFISHGVKQDKQVIQELIVPEVIQRRAQFGITKDTPHVDRSAYEASHINELDLLHYMIDYCDPVSGVLISPEKVAERFMVLIFSSMVTTAGILNHVLADLAGYGSMAMPTSTDNDNKSSDTTSKTTAESTSATKTTLWDALHNEQQQAIAAENDKLTFNALEQMPLLTSFIRESMRMAAAPIQHTRLAMKDGVFNGYAIEKGTFLFLSGYLNSYDETVFTEPHEFKPCRFLDRPSTTSCTSDSSVSSSAIITNAASTSAATPTSTTSSDPANTDHLGIFPFGVGRHVCAGRGFAMMELRMAVVTLMSQFRFSTTSRKVPSYRYEPSFCERNAEEVMFERIHEA